MKCPKCGKEMGKTKLQEVTINLDDRQPEQGDGMKNENLPKMPKKTA